MPFSWPQFTTHRSDVQSVANGILVDADTITLLASSRSGLPYVPVGSEHSPGGNHTVVRARLRRDGFASISDGGELHGHELISGTRLVTRLVVMDTDLKYLFVNVKVSRGGSVGVGVRDSDGRLLHGLATNQSTITDARAPSSQGHCTDTRCGGAARDCCEGSPAYNSSVRCADSAPGCDSCCGWVPGHVPPSIGPGG